MKMKVEVTKLDIETITTITEKVTAALVLIGIEITTEEMTIEEICLMEMKEHGKEKKVTLDMCLV